MNSKFTSRKFLTVLIAESAGITTLVTGILTALLGEGHIAVIITGAVMTALAGIAYCIVEGRLDERAISASGTALAGAADALGADKIGDLIEGVPDAVADVVGNNAGNNAEKTVPEDGKGEGDNESDNAEGRRIGF